MKLPAELRFRAQAKTPVFLSSEITECGLACLAMVGAYHGHDIDLNGLRQKASISIAGASLRGLMRLADQLGLYARALRVELSALRHVKLPAIVHWDMTHFVVLDSVGRKKVVIHDPSGGRRRVSVDEFSNHFTGVVLELSPSDSFAPVSARSHFRLSSLWSRLRGLTNTLGFVIVLSIAAQLLAFIAPFQMQLIVDQVLAKQDASLLVVVVVAFSAVGILAAAIAGIRSWTIQLLGAQFVFQVAGNVFRHMMRLPADYFEKRHIGDILSRIGSLRTIQDAFTQGILSALIDGGMALCAGIILFFYSSAVALVVITSVALVYILFVVTFPLLRRQTEQSIVAGAKEQTVLMESIKAALTIKLMGAEADRHATWRNVFSRSFNSTVALQRTQILVSFIQALLLTIQGGLVIYLSATDVLSGGGMSVGMLYALLAYSSTFTDRSMALIQQSQRVRMLRLYFERLADIVETPPESSGDAPLAAPPARGDIRVCDLSFRYGATDPLILKNVSFQVEERDFVAITGPTGAGKTTLLKLLLGLYAPTEGKILLGGEIASPELWQQWRATVGIVRQDDQLLSGSLADNIAFFDPDANMAEIRRVASLVAVDGDIAKMPMNYMTQIGDMGSSLSGGQRQRILLARALYRNPKVLVLDEGTANLDGDTEELIVSMIEALPVTRIVVAHRPALISKAKKVFRVREGSVERVR